MRALLLFSLLLAFGRPAFAGPDEDQIMREMVDAGAKAAAKEAGFEAGKQAMNLAVQSSPGPNGETVGGQAIAWVRVGLAVNDYANAKTDKARLFAAMDVAAAGVTIACPPAGAIVTAAVFVIKIADAVISHAHAKQMMEIAKRTQEHVEAMLKIYRELGAADFRQAESIIQRLNNELAIITDLQNKAAADCVVADEKNPDIDKLGACMEHTRRLFPHISNYLALSQSFFTFQSRFIDLDGILRSVGSSRAEEIARVENFRKVFVADQKKSDALFTEASRIVARAVVAKASAEGNFTPLQRLRNECYTAALGFNRQANLLLLPIGRAKAIERRTGLAELYAGSPGFNRACVELTTGQDDPLFRQLAASELTKAAVEAYLFETPVELNEVAQ